jgi:hypothetical protein
LRARELLARFRHAADRLVGLDLLALDAKQLRKAAALSGIDQIIACRLAAWAKLRLHDRILQQAEGGDAGGKGLEVRFRMRHLAHVLGRLHQSVERNKQNVLARGVDVGPVTHSLSPSVTGFCADSAHEPLPVGETG